MTSSVELNNSEMKKTEEVKIYPNPFNDWTSIKYELKQNAHINISIYNINGQKIARLIDNKYHGAGVYIIKWNASNVTSGTYICNININEFNLYQKMLLIR